MKKEMKNLVIVEDDVSKEGHEDEDLHAEQEVVLFGNVDRLISFINIGYHITIDHFMI